MRRTRELLLTFTMATTALAGCERSSRYREPPAGSYATSRFVLATEPPDTVTGAMVSREFFADSTIRPLLGRLFVPAEYGSTAVPVVVLSDKLWRQRFKRALNLIGTRIPLN